MSQAKLLNTKITKGQIDEALAAGATHAKFTNKGVQKRRLKEAAKVARNQERRDAHFRLVNKRAQEMRDAATAEITETVTAAAKAPEVVNEGASALMGLLGNIPAGHELIHDEAHREAMFHEHIASRLPTPEMHLTPEGQPARADFSDFKFKIGDVEYVQGEAYFPALGGMVDFTKTPPPVAVSFDAESKGLVIRPEDMQTAVDQSIERVQDGYVYGLSVATKFMDIDSHSEFEYAPPIDVLAFELKPYEPMNISALTNAGRYPLNIYGDANNYKPFPEIGDTVREDGLLAALPSTYNPDGVERAIDPVHDKLVYAEAGLSVGVEQVALVHVTLKEACEKAAAEPRLQFLKMGGLDPFAGEIGGNRAQMFSTPLAGSAEQVAATHAALTEACRQAGETADLRDPRTLGNAKPAPLVLHSTDGSKGVIVNVADDNPMEVDAPASKDD